MADEKKTFSFEFEGKSFDISWKGGKFTMMVINPKKDCFQRPATFLETAVAYQVMSQMFMRNKQS